MLQCRFGVVSVLALAFVLPALAQDKAVIDWKFEKGKTFYQELTTTTSQNMKVMGQEVVQKQNQTFYFSFTAKDEKDGVWTIVQKIEGVKMSIEIAGQSISYDSTNPTTTNNPLAEFFKSLINSEFTLTLDKAKRVTKVEGREDFIKKLTAANAQMQPLLKEILTDESLKQMADPTFGMAAGKEVAKGEAWERKNTVSLGPIGGYDSTYKYIYDGKEKITVGGKEETRDKIKIETTLTYKTPAPTTDTTLPFKIKSADLKTKDAGGTAVFDSAKGRLESMKLTQKLEGPIDVEIAGQTSKVDLKQEQTTEIKTSDTSPLVKKPT